MNSNCESIEKECESLKDELIQAVNRIEVLASDRQHLKKTVKTCLVVLKRLVTILEQTYETNENK